MQGRSLLPSATVSALLYVGGIAGASPFLDFVQQDPLGVGAVSDAVVSPDGAHLYVASFGEDAIAVLARDAGTGVLTPVEVVRDGVGGVEGLDGVEDVVVTPDGAHVYTAAQEEDAVSVFARNAGTGALTFLAVIRQGDPGIDGLDGARSLAIGPDGGTLYVVSGCRVVGCGPGALVVFDRDPGTGALSLQEVFVADDGNGLVAAADLAVTASGTGLHVASERGFPSGLTSIGSVVSFARDPSDGSLTFMQALKDRVAFADFEEAQAVAISPDDRHVYVRANTFGTFLVAFERTTGGLTLRQLGPLCTPGMPIGTLVAHPAGALVIAGGVALARDPLSGRLAVAEDVSEIIVAASPDGKHVYGQDGGVYSVGTCRPFVNPKLTLTRVGTDPLPANDGLSFKAAFLAPPGGFASFDPANDPVRIQVETQSAGTVLDVTLPAGLYAGGGTAGWVLNGSATKWKFVDKTGAPANGLRSVIVQDRSTKAADLVAVKVKGKNGTYPVVAGDEPLSVALELQGSTLCTVLPFVADDCGFNTVGDKLSCVRK